METIEIAWLDAPEAKDYEAAHDYLTLHFGPDRVRKIVERLRDGKIKTRKAKDIIRASGLTVLPETNPHVSHNLDKARAQQKLSPILLVRTGDRLIVADGYHRASAAYYASEDTDVPCVLVSHRSRS